MKKNDLSFFRHRGFTLIEVLLAAMIVALMGGSLYATFAAGFKLDHRIKQSFADLDDNRIIMEQLERDLGHAVFYDFRGSFPEQKTFFDAGEGLLFIINDGRQLRWVRYHLGVDQKGQVKSTQVGTTTSENVEVSNITTTEKSLRSLVRDEGDLAKLFNSNGEPQPDKSEALTRRVADEGWDMFYAPNVTPQAKIEWRSDWKEEYLPAAVRLELSLQNEKGQINKIERDFVLPAGGRNEI
ncbi:MAG: prepilin-type N-terminal cleavage/methylation domain-containing protein [Candidatus Omnitrophica bacterium]|nr:prepilin-type N-terminal cleavage/methylation domain-containing protein [Candidatus Omnitrophota bacterium]